MFLDLFVQLGHRPKVQVKLVAILLTYLLPDLGGDQARSSEHVMPGDRDLAYRQLIEQLLDFFSGRRGGKRLDAFALEGPLFALPPGDDIAPLLAARRA